MFCLTAAGLVRDLSNQQSLQDSHPIKEKRDSTKMALLLDAGGQLDAGMSFKPLTGQQQCTCLTTKVCVPHRLDSSSCFQPLTFQCMNPCICILSWSAQGVCCSTQDEKITETEDQKRPEKTAHIQISDCWLLKSMLGRDSGKGSMKSVSDTHQSSRTEEIIKLVLKT